jgi:hypothetical protein
VPCVRSCLRYYHCKTDQRHQALPRNDILALATLILSIPSITATIIGVFISYRSFKQFKTLCELSAACLPTENSDHFPSARQSTILPVYRLPSRPSFPYTTGFDTCTIRIPSTMSDRRRTLCATCFKRRQLKRGLHI